MEGLANIRDCSNCTIRPTSANCVPLYDISYTYSRIGTSNKWNLDISNAITDKVLLVDGLGLSWQETSALRQIWQKLRNRRINRK
jgi:hypothetical protein